MLHDAEVSLIIKIKFFQLFGIKICFLEPEQVGTSRSRAFMGGARNDIFYLEPELKKKYLEPDPWKNGSAPQLCTQA